MSNLSDFDLDLSFGQEGEQLVKDLLTGGKTIEVKRDRRWIETGNLYIEGDCWSMSYNAWVPSGLKVTKAEYWAFVLESLVVIVPTEKLKQVVISKGRQIVNNRPPNPSSGWLITLNDIAEVERGK